MLSVSHCFAIPNRILSPSVWFIITSKAYIKDISLFDILFKVKTLFPKLEVLIGRKNHLQGGVKIEEKIVMCYLWN